MSKTIIIIGAGLAGLSAALQAAENGCNVKLVSSLPSERAQSVMAEGDVYKRQMYVHRRNIRKDIYQKVKMYRCSNLTILLL